MTIEQALHQQLRVAGEHAGLRGSEEVNGFAGDCRLIGEDCAERAADGAQKLGEIGTDGFFRRAQLDGQQPAGREMRARHAEELLRIEAVQLRGLRIGYIDDDDVESFTGFGQVSSAIEKMQVHAQISCAGAGAKGRGLRRKILLRHRDQRGIELDVVEAGDGGMLERLGHAAVDAAADEQHAARSRVLEKRVVDGFFGCGGIGRVGEDGAVFVETSDRAGIDRAGFGDDEIAVDGVALGDHVEAAPETRARSGIAAWSDPNQQRNRGQRGRNGEERNLRALHAEKERRGDGEIEQAHDGRDLKGIEKTDEDNAGQDSAERGAGGFDEIGRARGGACG